jgi:CRISPR/Cas system CMR-associated protein Cmr1 (group 7 of RAMP superfamily)
MKLHKALKLRKKLIGEIAQLKAQIQVKNSYLVGSLNPKKYNVPNLYKELMDKIDQLTGLKFVINEANREIQSKIYVLSEYKALITFWNGVPVAEGTQEGGRFGSETLREFAVQIDEQTKTAYIKEFQEKVDALQEEIDTYNYTTDVPWGNLNEDISE